MPYTPPAVDQRTRNHKRSFTDEHGQGAFAPLPSLPRRAKPASITIAKAPSPPISIQVQSPSTQKKFQLRGSSEDSEDDDDEEAQPVQPPDSIPFPSLASPLPRQELNGLSRSVSTPTIPSPSTQDSPSIYKSPFASARASPNSRNLRPLKPSLKSNHSSPHLPSLGSPNPRIITQSAPTTPHNLPASITPSGPNSPELDSPHSPSSALPQTPKQVHFAAEKSSLESVVVFAKTARPRSLSTGGNDTETETEGYDSSTNWGTWNSSRYPFPIMPKGDETIVLMDDSKTSTVPATCNTGSGGIFNGERAMVYLETLTLPSSKPPALRGSILVRNVAFQKRVAVRFTLDDWQTTSEVSCPYAASLPSLPPPFAAQSHAPKSSPLGLSLDGTNGSFTPVNLSQPTTTNANLSMGGKQDAWDRFTFVIKLEDVERSLVNKRLFLVVRYNIPSQWGFETGGEWWDNNVTKNYEVGFKIGKRVTHGAGSTAPSAATATVPSSTSSTSAGRTTSLPPLPPPGPIRPTATATGLKAKPKLAPILPSLNTGEPPLLLRQGRGPTFVEARGTTLESPPGSPRRPDSASTTYTPPMPGALPISPSSSLTNVRDALGPATSTSTPSMYAEKPATAGYASKSPGLSISTGVTPTIVPTGGKKRLSLSNYASPIKTSSTSPTSTPPASRTSSIYSTASSTSPVTPFDGGLGLKIVGGMPATMIDESGNLNGSGGHSRVGSSNSLSGMEGMRIPSWEDASSAAAIWFGNSNTAGGLKGGGEDKKSAATIMPDLPDVEQPILPTPPDSSAGSNTSTPDLELSPEVGTSEVDGPEEEGKPMVSFLKSSPPLAADDDEGSLSPSSSVSTVKVTSPRTGSRAPSGLSSSRPSQKASFTTSGSSQSSSSSGSEGDDDPWNIIRPPSPEKQISNLDKRVNQGRMRLDIPSRPVWKGTLPTAATPPTMASAIPPARSFGLGSRSNSLDAVNLASAGGSSGSFSSGKRNPSTLGMSDSNSAGSTPHRTGSVDGLSSMGGTGPGGAFNGPPPEFLAKYCFFVSSPATTPSAPVPVGSGSGVSSPGGAHRGQHARGVSEPMGVFNKRSGYSSPSAIGGASIPVSASPSSISGLDSSMFAMGLGMSPPGQGASFSPTGAFVAGVDTPRASSPSLSGGSSNWWAFGGGAQKVNS